MRTRKKARRQDRTEGAPSPPAPAPPGFLQQLRAYPLLTAAGLVVLLLVFTLALFAPRYETLDDAVMNLIVAGRAFSDTPDEHLLFSNVLLGISLRGLYRTAADVPWYGLYLTAVTALALWGLCYALLRARPCGARVLLAGGFLLAAGLPCLMWLQFTRAAALAALAGMALLLVAAGDRVSPWTRVAGVGLLLLACLVRFEGCLLVCVVLAPAVAAALATARPRPRVVLAGCLAGALAAGWGLARFNSWYYERDPGWRGFYEHNALRARFTDYLPVEYNERTRPFLEAAGWSPTDLAMLYQFSFADREHFSTQKLRAVLDAAGPGDRVKAWRSWAELWAMLRGDSALAALLGLGAACLALMGGGWRARVVPLLCLLAAACLAVVLFHYFHLVPRVYFPAFAAGVALTLLRSPGEPAWHDLHPGTPAGAARLGAVLVAAALLARSIDRDLETDAQGRGRHLEAVKMMARLAPRPDQLHVLWNDAFPYTDLAYPLERPSVPRDFKAVALLWLTRTPLTERRLREFGIDGVYRGLYEHPGVRLLSNPVGNRLMDDYLAQHYGARFGFRVVFADPALGQNRFYVLIDLPRLRQAKPAPRRASSGGSAKEGIE